MRQVIFSRTVVAAVASIGLSQPVLERGINPGPRRGHCLVFDGRLRRVVLLGGYQPSDQPPLEQVWSFDGAEWGRLPGAGPAARSLCGAAYDSRRDRVILFGGVGNKGYSEPKGDTWEWDGETWRQATDTTVGTRDHHVMAYDSRRGRTVMYGGLTSSRSWATDTWEWDGAHWSRFTTPGPGARAHFAMVYDSKRERIVLFGGLGDDNQYHADTWEWDGVTWRKMSDEGPPARARHRMAFDERAGVVVLYGGDGVKTQPGSGFRALDDTWTWDGKRWTQVRTVGPGSRFMHAMAYDAARGRVVLYGGGSSDASFDDTWEWDGGRWLRVR